MSRFHYSTIKLLNALLTFFLGFHLLQVQEDTVAVDIPQNTPRKTISGPMSNSGQFAETIRCLVTNLKEITLTTKNSQ